jgi:hypothetical protein
VAGQGSPQRGSRPRQIGREKQQLKGKAPGPAHPQSRSAPKVALDGVPSPQDGLARLPYDCCLCRARFLLNRLTRYTKNQANPANTIPTTACVVDRRSGSLIQ